MLFQKVISGNSIFRGKLSKRNSVEGVVLRADIGGWCHFDISGIFDWNLFLCK